MDFELLPDLVLYRVFSFFDSIEKIQLKLVCRRWQFLLQEKILLVHEPEIRTSWKWFDFLKSIEGRNVYEVTFDKETRRYLPDNSTLQNNQFDQIKKLYAFGINGLTRLLSQLVHLRQLEILKIENCANDYKLEEEHQIDLPKLRVLLIKNCFSNLERMFSGSIHFCTGALIRIRAPNLAYCALTHFTEDAKLQLECFEKIRYIRCDYFDGKTAGKAVNLETLVCLQFELPFNLHAMPKLKEVALFPFKPVSPAFKLDFATGLKHLQEQRTSLSRFDMKIVVNGFEESIEEFFRPDKQVWLGIENYEDVRLDIFTEENAELIARNYNKLVRPLPFKTEVNYTQLTNVFNGQIPANFFKNFPEIVGVSVHEHLVNTSHLLNFLRSCSDLQRLELKNCRYGEKFYEELLHFQSLNHLIIEELSGQIDFAFILQFKHLIGFELQSNCMPFDLAYEFLKGKGVNFVFKKLNSEIVIKIWYYQKEPGNRLFIDGRYVSGRLVGERTLDNYFLFLKNHEYRKFFI